MPRPSRATHAAAVDRRVALVLQGGGALGSYQAGVFEEIADTAYQPDWVAGISIGAINAAIIAGNPPQERVAQLRRFWETVTAPPRWAGWTDLVFGAVPELRRQAGAANAVLFGQSGFFAPQPPDAWLRDPPPTSFYDTTALKGTLESLIDFDRINHRDGIRLSVGAVNVETGNFAYFDSAETPLRAEHVMASGALPTGFPAVEIDGEHFWDGGLVSNTPLQYVIAKLPRRSRLIFQVDVFPARGRLPRTLLEAAEREKDIRYSSRTRAGSDVMRTVHDLRHNIDALLAKLPEALRETPEARFLRDFGCKSTMDVAQLIYRPEDEQGQAKDYEFSRGTMVERWARGRADARETLDAAPWREPMPPDAGARSFDVVGDRLRVQGRRDLA
jgi:NTE family protein